MATVLPAIDDAWAQWLGEQQMFFIATAPSGNAGHVNCSPRGADTFRILDAHTVMWGDRTGSGAETISHLRDNGRIVLMFCAFSGAPAILRLHGRGEICYPSQPRYTELGVHLPTVPGLRAIIVVHVTRITRSCGLNVPNYLFAGRREALDEWADKKSPAELLEYRQRKNARSIDGLPAYPTDAGTT